MTFKMIQGISDIWKDYDGYFVDLWGVIHDGSVLYPGVLACLQELQNLNKKVIFLSNAPRKSRFVSQRLEQLGISPNLYQGIVTSGDAAFDALKEQHLPNFGNKVFHVGPEKDRHMLEVEGLKEVEDFSKADFLLVTDTYEWRETLENYRPLLEKSLEKKIPLVCVNPDLIVHIEDEKMICGGTLADWYKDQGGHVVYHGKPHEDVYDRALEMVKGIDARRIVCIGDSLRTDVSGALNKDLSVVLISGGIHRDDYRWDKAGMPLKEDLEKLFQEHQKIPTYVLTEFKA